MTKPNGTKYEGKPFKYASLFSGIGGFEQALNKIGGECVFASEIDKFASRAYEVLYGDNPHGDITEIDAKDIPDHDLLVGGFPCVSFSVAGKRAGMIHICIKCDNEQNISFEEYINKPKCGKCGGKLKPKDPRGVLFFEIARVALAKKPRALLIENVKGLVNHDKGRTLDVMIETLNEIGYVIDFDVLNSKYFGVPQNRERIFIVALRNDIIEDEPFNEETTTGNTIVPRRKRAITEWARTFNFDWPEQTEVTTRLRDILEPSVDEKYYLSDDKTAKLIAQLEANPSEDDIPLENMGRLAGLRNRADRVFAYQDDKKRSTAQENIYLRDEAITDSVTVGHMPKYINTEPQMLGHVDIKGHDAIKRVYSAESVGPTLTTMSGGHREPKIAEEQEIANKDNISYCIDANYSKGISPSSIGKGRRTHVEVTSPKYRIRKLTPKECWRLQGFPDEAHDAVMNAGISDSQRYKQAGNAITVNVVEEVGKKLLEMRLF